jgi:hypothetical protein
MKMLQWFQQMRNLETLWEITRGILMPDVLRQEILGDPSGVQYNLPSVSNYAYLNLDRQMQAWWAIPIIHMFDVKYQEEKSIRYHWDKLVFCIFRYNFWTIWALNYLFCYWTFCKDYDFLS